MTNLTEAFIENIRNGKNPYIKIARHVKSELDKLALSAESSESKSKEVYYTFNVKRVKKGLEEDGVLKKEEASTYLIGRAIKATLDFLGFNQGKDYTAKGGSDSGARYVLEIDISKIRKESKIQVLNQRI